MWDAFKSLILQFLLWIQTFTGDWGLAIVVLTVIVRAILWPLTAKQVRSTYELQKIQPEMKRIQDKYADDKEKQQEELMKFYSEHKVNPFASCLPMILQMPIFIALYQVLGPVTEGMLKKASMGQLSKTNLFAYLDVHNAAGSFFGLIPDITQSTATVFKTGFVHAIPYLILLIIFGLSMWLPQAMMPGEKSQKMMGLYMAVFMLWIGWSAPAGVLLYWDVSSLLGIAQQQITQNAVKRALGDNEKLVEEAIEEADDEPDKKKKKAKRQAQTKESQKKNDDKSAGK